MWEHHQLFATKFDVFDEFDKFFDMHSPKLAQQQL